MIVDKPWGKVVTYALNQPSSVRVITVEPGQETSVHYHQMRDEMWVVLDPGLSVQIGNRQVEASSGEEFMVSAETTHRIANPGTTRGRVLEIAYGYTTEDDTLRLQADYGRPLEPDWRAPPNAVVPTRHPVERSSRAVLRSARSRHRRARWQSRAM